MARIAIGIPVFNEEKYVASTLATIIQQLDDFLDIEIWVSDNGSSDRSFNEIESVVNSFSQANNAIKLVRHPVNLGADFNFWYVFDNSDSELFLWVGAHDQLSKGYVAHGVRHMLANPDTSMFCGTHKALSASGQQSDHDVNYDFSQKNPAERYLRSIATLGNCYIFHSIFRRTALDSFERQSAPSSDHILISRFLWFGRLELSANCFYKRRYFSGEDRSKKTAAGNYVHSANNVEFYEAYLSDLEILASSRLPQRAKNALIAQASAMLVNRFGTPFVSMN